MNTHTAWVVQVRTAALLFPDDALAAPWFMLEVGMVGLVARVASKPANVPAMPAAAGRPNESFKKKQTQTNKNTKKKAAAAGGKPEFIQLLCY